MLPPMKQNMMFPFFLNFHFSKVKFGHAIAFLGMRISTPTSIIVLFSCTCYNLGILDICSYKIASS